MCAGPRAFSLSEDKLFAYAEFLCEKFIVPTWDDNNAMGMLDDDDDEKHIKINSDVGF